MDSSCVCHPSINNTSRRMVDESMANNEDKDLMTHERLYKLAKTIRQKMDLKRAAAKLNLT